MSRHFTSGNTNRKSLPQEVWVDVPEFEGYYRISNMGRLKSLARTRKCNGGLAPVPERVMKIEPRPYRHTTLHGTGGKVRNACVHRLVAEAFIPNPHNYPEINHKNGCKVDDRASNLEWTTRAGNARHASRYGLLARGERVGTSRLSEVTVIKILERLAAGGPRGFQVQIAKEFGIGPDVVSRIKLGQPWAYLRRQA